MIDITDQNEVVEESIAEWCPKVRNSWSKSVQDDYKNLGSEVQAELNQVAVAPFNGYPKPAEKKLFCLYIKSQLNMFILKNNGL